MATRSTTTAAARVIVYVRISQDALGLEKGVTSQLAECRDYAARMGWEVVEVITDNDLTALTSGTRPGYRQLMQAVRDGRADFVVAFQMSRLWRNRVERAEAFEVLKNARCGAAFAKGPTFDFTTASGRGMAGMLGEVDTMESEIKSERILVDVVRRAEAGLPNGSIPFGWRREYTFNDQGKRTGVIGDRLHPEQAPVVAEVCRRLLSGQTLIAVTSWLNKSGVPAPGAGYNLRKRRHGIVNPDGARWGKTSVRKLALRPANAGLRLYHRGRPDEQVRPTSYVEPIITVDEHERLKALMARNPGAGVITRPGGRVHLLSWGVGECGVCGGVLRSKPAKGTPLYVCDAKGCVGRNEAQVDRLITGLVAERLAYGDGRDLLMDNEAADAAMGHAAGLRARLAAAADDYADGLLDRTQLVTITARLRPQIEQADRAASAAAPTVPVELLAEVAGERAEKKFKALAVSQQRVLVAFLFERVVINPTRRGPGFEPSDVVPVWRQPLMAAAN